MLLGPRLCTSEGGAAVFLLSIFLLLHLAQAGLVLLDLLLEVGLSCLDALELALHVAAPCRLGGAAFQVAHARSLSPGALVRGGRCARLHLVEGTVRLV